MGSVYRDGCLRKRHFSKMVDVELPVEAAIVAVATIPSMSSFVEQSDATHLQGDRPYTTPTTSISPKHFLILNDEISLGLAAAERWDRALYNVLNPIVVHLFPQIENRNRPRTMFTDATFSP